MQGKVYRYKGAPDDPLAVWNGLGLTDSARWFGWSETALYLPNPLPNALPDEPWERLSLFNAQAELRMLSRGGKPALLLLTETLEPPDDAWEACGEYDAEERIHILLGDPPKRAGGATTQLAEVAFPAVFDYGIPLAPSRNPIRKKVVADARYYYDAERRLRYIRYAGIRMEEFER
jgi:hypothetical protein